MRMRLIQTLFATIIIAILSSCLSNIAGQPTVDDTPQGIVIPCTDEMTAEFIPA